MLVSDISVKIPATPEYNYSIYIGQNLLEEYKQWLLPLVSSKKIVIITDEIVNKLYAKNFATNLKKYGYDVVTFEIVPGEQSKNYTQLMYLLDAMLLNKCDRHSFCIALGGGVVGDIAGFTSAIFMRGIRYIQIPTTVLSMIDSSVGGKTAINSSFGKNLIGAFYQPQAVIMDINLINSLPTEHLINGLIEAIKVFLTHDAEYFNYVDTHLEDIVLNRDYNKLTKIIKRAIMLKADIVETDEKEKNLRMVLNFGHSVGHAIEQISNYKIMHGYAVALGILVEAKIAVLLGLLANEDYIQIVSLLSKLGITKEQLHQFKVVDIVSKMLGDKKNIAGDIYMILLNKIGDIKLSTDNKVVHRVSNEIITKAFASLV